MELYVVRRNESYQALCKTLTIYMKPIKTYEEPRYRFQDFSQTLPKGSVLLSGSTELILNSQGYDDSHIFVECVTPSKVPYYASLSSLKVRLQQLTLQFVRRHASYYYQQFKGDLYDLAQDFFIEFLTPKARTGRKETLLDKYNSKVTSFEYLVKNAVIRKLIDRSRKDRYQSLSIDRLQEEYGDCITETFQLVEYNSSLKEFVDPSVDERIFTEDEVEFYRSKFEQLSENVRQSFVKEYFKVRTVFANGYRDLFDSVVSISPLPKVSGPFGPQPQVSERSFNELANAMLSVLSSLS